MENSILISTKKVLGIAPTYTAFDLDIITHINAAFSILNQLGVGPVDGFMIESQEELWADFGGEEFVDVPMNQLNLVKTYVFLKVRLLFDPPSTSYLIEAASNQAKEYEWRLSTFREWALDPVDPLTVVVEEVEV